jgi:opacity protein-like surface antigen
MDLRKMSSAAAVAVLATIPVAAGAQEAVWTYEATVYGWASALSTSIDTPQGSYDGDLSIGDVLSDLDFAAMGAFEARRDRFGLMADIFYSDLSDSTSFPPGGQFSAARLGSKLAFGSGYATYRIHETPTFGIDIAGGLRVINLDTDASLGAGTSPGRSFSSQETWVEPVIGVRAGIRIDENWSLRAFADVGGTADSSSWQLLGTVGYAFDETWSVRAGWRYMQIRKEMGAAEVTLDLSGPLIGVAARF